MEHETPTMSVEEAAELLGISRGLVYEAVRSGQLPSIRVGRRVLIPRIAIFRRLGFRYQTGAADIRARVVRLAEALEDGDLNLANTLARDLEADLATDDQPS